MNLPNKLTVFRIILTPFFLVSLVVEFPFHYLLALIVFAAASLTDMADGKIARKRGLVTDFGKFLDPLADKMLTTAAFLGFILMNAAPGIVYIAFIVLFREFLITSLRLIAASTGKVIAANMWGKSKTVSQMVGIIVTLAFYFFKDLFQFPTLVNNIMDITVAVLLWLSAVLTVVSGVIYVKDNKKFLNPKK